MAIFEIPSVVFELVKSHVKMAKIQMPTFVNWKTLPIIAIGPKGGKIVGYGAGGKPIYAGTPKAEQLEAIHAQAQTGHKATHEDIKTWLEHLEIPAKVEEDGVYVTNAAGRAIQASYGVNGELKDEGKMVRFNLEALKPFLGKPLKPKEDEHLGWAAGMAAGEGEGKSAFPDLKTLKQIAAGVYAGSHGNLVFEDPTGRKWIFKAANPTIARAEEAASRLGRLILGEGKVPPAKYLRVNGKEGVLVGEIPGEVVQKGHHKTLDNWLKTNFDQLVEHQMFDWLVSNHDSHAGNFLTEGGSVAAIDKGQAWRFFGQDQLSDDYSPNPSAPVYNRMWELYQSGEIKADPVKAAADVLERVKEITPEQFHMIVAPYVATMAGYAGVDADERIAAMTSRLVNLKNDWGEFLSKMTGATVTIPEKGASEVAPKEVVVPSVKKEPALVIENPDAIAALEKPEEQKVELVTKPIPEAEKKEAVPVIPAQPKVSGWPKTKGSVTVYHPGGDLPSGKSWAKGYPGPGYKADIIYKKDKFVVEFLEGAKGIEVSVMYPDGSAKSFDSPNAASDSLYLYAKKLPLDMTATEKKAKGISYPATKAFGIISFADELKGAATGGEKSIAEKTPTELEKDKEIAPEAKQLTVYEMLKQHPMGVVTDMAVLPALIQGKMQEVQKTQTAGPEYYGAPAPGTAVLHKQGDGLKVFVAQIGTQGEAKYIIYDIDPKTGAAWYGGSVSIAQSEEKYGLSGIPNVAQASIPQAIPEEAKAHEPVKPEEAEVPLPQIPMGPEKAIQVKLGKADLEKMPVGAQVHITYEGDTYPSIATKTAADSWDVHAQGAFVSTHSDESLAGAIPESDLGTVTTSLPQSAESAAEEPKAVKTVKPAYVANLETLPPAVKALYEAHVAPTLHDTYDKAVDKPTGWPFWTPPPGVLVEGKMGGKKVYYLTAVSGHTKVGAPNDKYAAVVITEDGDAFEGGLVDAASAIDSLQNATTQAANALGTGNALYAIWPFPEEKIFPPGSNHISIEAGAVPEAPEAQPVAPVSAPAPKAKSPKKGGAKGITVHAFDQLSVPLKQKYGHIKSAIDEWQKPIEGMEHVKGEKSPNWPAWVPPAGLFIPGEYEGKKYWFVTTVQGYEKDSDKPGGDYACAILGEDGKHGSSHVFMTGKENVALKAAFKSISGASLTVGFLKKMFGLDKAAFAANETASSVLSGKGVSALPVVQAEEVPAIDDLTPTAKAEPVLMKTTIKEALKTHNLAKHYGKQFTVKPSNKPGHTNICLETGGGQEEAAKALSHLMAEHNLPIINSGGVPKKAYSGAFITVPDEALEKEIAVPMTQAEAAAVEPHVSPDNFETMPDVQPQKVILGKTPLAEVHATLEALPVGAKVIVANHAHYLKNDEGKWLYSVKGLAGGEYITGPWLSGKVAVDIKATGAYKLKVESPEGKAAESGKITETIYGANVSKATLISKLQSLPIDTLVVISDVKPKENWVKQQEGWYWFKEGEAGGHPASSDAFMATVLQGEGGVKLEYPSVYKETIHYNGSNAVTPLVLSGKLEKAPVGAQIIVNADYPKIAWTKHADGWHFFAENGLEADVQSDDDLAAHLILLSHNTHEITWPMGKASIPAPAPEKQAPKKKYKPTPPDPKVEAAKLLASKVADWHKKTGYKSITDAKQLHVLAHFQKLYKTEHPDLKVWAKALGNNVYLGSSSPDLKATLEAHSIPHKEIEGPLGSWYELDADNLAKSLPGNPAGTITGPNGKVYPAGTTFESKINEQSVLDLLPGEPGFNKVVPHKTHAGSSILKVHGTGPEAVKQLKDIIAKYKLKANYPEPMAGGSNTIMEFADKELNKTGKADEEIIATVPDQPPAFASESLPGMGSGAIGEEAANNRSDLGMLDTIIPSKFGHAIRMGTNGIFEKNQINVRKLKTAQGKMVYEFSGKALSYDGSKAALTSAEINMLSSMKPVEGSARHTYDPATGITQETNKTFRTYSGAKGQTDNASIAVILDSSGNYMLNKQFMIQIPMDANVEDELSKAFQKMGLNAQDAMAAPTEHDDLVWKKEEVVRAGMGAIGYSSLMDAKEKMKPAQYEKFLDSKLTSLGMTDQVAQAKIVHGFAGAHCVQMNDMDKIKEAGVKFVAQMATNIESVAFNILEGAGWASRNNRYINGVQTDGASANTDESTGGANFAFCRLASNSKTWGNIHSNGPKIIFHPRVLLRADWVAHNGDNFGAVKPGYHYNSLTSTSHGRWADLHNGGKETNELNFEKGVSLRDVAGVAVSSEYEKEGLIARLTKGGLTEVNSIPLDKFVVVHEGGSKGLLAKKLVGLQTLP